MLELRNYDVFQSLVILANNADPNEMAYFAKM